MNLLPFSALCVSVTLASMGLRPAGWLDRLVQYHRQKFLRDFNDVAPVEIKVTIQPKFPGYVDSKAWDFDSVMRLLLLIRESETAAPVRRALRRSLRSNRRSMSRLETFYHFPSLSKNFSFNDMYYDIDSGEIDEAKLYVPYKPGYADEDDILFISNPVEARLPSRQISIRLLKEIMESRAIAAREMPTQSTIPEEVENTTEAVDAGEVDSGAANKGNGTGDGATTSAGAEAATTAPAPAGLKKLKLTKTPTRASAASVKPTSQSPASKSPVSDSSTSNSPASIMSSTKSDSVIH